MTWPHLHTILNHFPVVLTVVGMLAALFGLVRPRRSTWMYAVVSLTLAGAGAWPAWLSGDEAADTLKHAWYIVPATVRAHSQAGDATLWVLLAVGVISAFAWWRLVRTPAATTLPAWLRVIVVVAAIAAFGAVTYTAWLGGAIVVNSAILASPVPPAPVPDTVRLPAAPAPRPIAPGAGAPAAGTRPPGP